MHERTCVPDYDLRPDPATASWWTEQGQAISEVVFDDGDTWCLRRVLDLQFIDERRGEWSIMVDFTVPPVEEIDLLTIERGPVEGRPDLLIPLLTFPKDFLPAAHVNIVDQRGDHLSLAGSESSRHASFSLAVAAAEQANVELDANWNRLWRLTSPDSTVATSAWHSLQEALPTTPDHTDVESAKRFFAISHLLMRSVFLLLEFPFDSLDQRRIVTFSHDGPIRITRGRLETFGLRPLTIAPRCHFGGNAKSYHMQMHSPERITVVDSRILYSYFSKEPIARGCSECSSDEEGDRRPADQVLQEPDQLKVRSGPWSWLGWHGFRQWWGQVEGPAEPMSAHVRCSGARMPRLEHGREVFTVFQLYPQFAGQLTLFFIAAAANVGFAWALFLGIVWGQPNEHHSLGFNQLAHEHPEAILIMAVLVIGFGVGLILYPKEHLITSGVLRPWRWVEGLIMVATLSVAMTALWGWRTGVSYLRPNVLALLIEVLVDTAAFLFLAVIIARPWFAEPEGVHGWQHTGLFLRRRGYPRRWWPPWRGRVIDDKEIAQKEADDGSERWMVKRAVLLDRKLRFIKRRFALKLLIDSSSRKLFNRGIPPAIRHDRQERGY